MHVVQQRTVLPSTSFDKPYTLSDVLDPTLRKNIYIENSSLSP